MDFNKYKKTEGYPQSRDFSTTYFYGQGKILGSAQTNNEGDIKRLHEEYPQAVTETCIDNPAVQAAQAAWAAHDLDLKQQFVKDSFDDLGLDDNEFTRALHAIAQEDHRRDGLHRVYQRLEEIAPLVNIAKRVYCK